LEHGAKVDLRNPPPVPTVPPAGGTILLASVDYNDLANEQGTALHYAIERGAVESVKVLLAHGANVNLLSGNGWTPLGRAIDRWPSIGSPKGRADVVECVRLL